MRVKIIAANWKMNGNLQLNAELLEAVQSAINLTENEACIIFPPSLYLQSTQSLLKNSRFSLGAQNVHFQNKGAFTGEQSAPMLKDIGVNYVLIGHSERRTLFNESDETVYRKVLNAHNNELTPVLCIGESLSERENGQTEAIIAQQLEQVLDNPICLDNAIIAYEPVWAIGTGKTASPQQAQDVHAYIRSLVAKKSEKLAEKVSILYGGSVNEENAAALFACPDIDGGLVGGASLDPNKFVEIIKCIK